MTKPSTVGSQSSLGPGIGLGGSAGGDVGGVLPGGTVVQAIQGVPVCVTAPALNDVLTFDGTDWCPAPIAPSGVDIVTDGVTTVSPVTMLTVPLLDDLGGGNASLPFLTSKGAEQSLIVTDAAVTGTYAFDLSLGNWFDLTLTGNVTSSTISNPPPAGGIIHIILRQGGAGSFTFVFPASFVWQAADGTNTGSAPTLHIAVGAINTIEAATADGGTTWGAADEAGGTGSSLTIKDEGTPLATAATSLDFVGAGVTASGSGAGKTITIPGGATASDTGIWRPLLDGATGAIIVNGTTGEAVMGFGPA